MTRTTNPLRFGLNARGTDFKQIVEQCRAAEDAGFELVAFSDRPSEPNLEAWTAITAVGALTKRLILTNSTLNIPYRNPALTAKMAATLDVITGGRVQLTLGAGGQEPHFRAYGIPFGSPGERFTDLKDAVAIMRGMWQGEFTYTGRQYRVEKVTVEPRPVRGTIPIWIGAFRPRMMRFTGAAADGWLKNGGWPESIDQLRGLVRLLEEGAERAGRDPRTVRRALNCASAVTDGASPSFGTGYAPPAGMVGKAAMILETIAQHRDEGIDTFHVRLPDRDTVEHIRRFGAEVIAKAKGM